MTIVLTVCAVVAGVVRSWWNTRMLAEHRPWRDPLVELELDASQPEAVSLEVGLDVVEPPIDEVGHEKRLVSPLEGEEQVDCRGPPHLRLGGAAGVHEELLDDVGSDGLARDLGQRAEKLLESAVWPVHCRLKRTAPE